MTGIFFLKQPRIKRPKVDLILQILIFFLFILLPTFQFPENLFVFCRIFVAIIIGWDRTLVESQIFRSQSKIFAFPSKDCFNEWQQQNQKLLQSSLRKIFNAWRKPKPQYETVLSKQLKGSPKNCKIKDIVPTSFDSHPQSYICRISKGETYCSGWSKLKLRPWTKGEHYMVSRKR